MRQRRKSAFIIPENRNSRRFIDWSNVSIQSSRRSMPSATRSGTVSGDRSSPRRSPSFWSVAISNTGLPGCAAQNADTSCSWRFHVVAAAFARVAMRNGPWRRAAGSPNMFAPRWPTGSSCTRFPSDCGSTSVTTVRYWVNSLRPRGGRSAPFTRRPAVGPMGCRAWSGRSRPSEI